MKRAAVITSALVVWASTLVFAAERDCSDDPALCAAPLTKEVPADDGFRHSIRIMFDDEISTDPSSGGQPSAASSPGTERQVASGKGNRTLIRVHELTGEISGIHADLMQEEWFEDDEFHHARPVLWDLRQAKLPSDYAYLSKVVSQLANNSMAQRPTGRASIVVASFSDLTVLCMAYRKSIEQGRMLITTSVAEARTWLVGDQEDFVRLSTNQEAQCESAREPEKS